MIMHKFYNEHIINMRLREVAHHQERIDFELNALAGKIDTGVFEVLLEIQKELDYKWSFFSGLMPSSLAFYVCGITNINPLEFDFLFERYCNVNYDKTASITIELPLEIELSQFSYIAERYGYSIIKEEKPNLEPDTAIYHFVKLISPQSVTNLAEGINAEANKEVQGNWLLEKTEVYVIKSHFVHILNRAFSGFSGIEIAIKFMRVDPSCNRGWDEVRSGTILKYFNDLSANLVDFYFDYRIDNFDKLANFIAMYLIKDKYVQDRLIFDLNNNKYIARYTFYPQGLSLLSSSNLFIYHEDIIKFLKVIFSMTTEEATYIRMKLAKNPTETYDYLEDMIDYDGKGYSVICMYILKKIVEEGKYSFSKSFIYKHAYELFVLNHLEHCYPKEFKKGMGNTSG